MATIYYKDGSSWSQIMASAYPVGAVYLTTSSTSPASIFGGTWSETVSRRYLRGYESADDEDPGTTGGSNFISVAQLPAHSHTTSSNGAHTHSVNYSATAVRSGQYWQPVTQNAEGTTGSTTSYTASAGAHTHTISTVGGGSVISLPITSCTSGRARRKGLVM